MSKKKVRFCVDLDGVLAQYDGWKGFREIGEPFEGAVDFVEHLRTMGEVVIFSTRASASVNTEEVLADIGRISAPPHYITKILKGNLESWLEKHGFHYEEVYVGEGKPLADIYIDDRAYRLVVGKSPISDYEKALADIQEIIT